MRIYVGGNEAYIHSRIRARSLNHPLRLVTFSLTLFCHPLTGPLFFCFQRIINQVASSKTKGLFRYIEAEDADVLVLSETKVSFLFHSILATLYFKGMERLICYFILLLSLTFTYQVNDLSSVEIASDMKDLRERYPYRYWGIGDKKGYAGVAILSKIKPVSKEIGLPGLGAESKGRLSEYLSYYLWLMSALSFRW